jgi:hypothetical protein
VEQEKVIVFPHFTYSPDLTPFDFFLFPELKIAVENLLSSSTSVLQYFSVFIIDNENASKDWIWKLKLCLTVGGVYFEVKKQTQFNEPLKTQIQWDYMHLYLNTSLNNL